MTRLITTAAKGICRHCGAAAAPYRVDRIGALCSRCAAQFLVRTERDKRGLHSHSLLVSRVATAYLVAARADREWRVRARVARSYPHRTGRADARAAARASRKIRDDALARVDSLNRYAMSMGLRILTTRDYAICERISLSAARARARDNRVLRCKNHRGEWLFFVPRTTLATAHND